MITAAAAPAVPATMKLAPLQEKSSNQTCHTRRSDVAAMAPAISPVLTTKYVAIAPTRGLARPANSPGASWPPSQRYTAPVATIVSASAAMLKVVRYHGYERFTRTVHCVQTPAT